jgi:cell division protein FtsL
MLPSFKLQTDNSPRASLGCGTLIVITLIFATCTSFVSQDFRHQLGGLRSDIDELKEAIDAQTTEMQALRDSIKKGDASEKVEPAQPGK